MPKVPNRWLCYEPMRRCISGTSLLAFKVPLKKAICDHLPCDKRFTPQTLIEQVRVSGRPLGLIIDLTNTSRYYNPQEVIQAGIEYHKLFTEGHVIPNNKIVQSFTRVIQEFTSKSSNKDLLIGVHCTHGINRTGYLICRYMVEHLGFTAPEALTAFAEARGYSVERQNYIDNLHEISAAKQTSKTARNHHIHFDEFDESSSVKSNDTERSNKNTAQCESNLKKFSHQDASSSVSLSKRVDRQHRSDPCIFKGSKNQRRRHRSRSLISTDGVGSDYQSNGYMHTDIVDPSGCPSGDRNFYRRSQFSPGAASSRDVSFDNEQWQHNYPARTRGRVQRTGYQGQGHVRKYPPDDGQHGFQSTWSQSPAAQSAWSRFHGYQGYSHHGQPMAPVDRQHKTNKKRKKRHSMHKK